MQTWRLLLKTVVRKALLAYWASGAPVTEAEGQDSTLALQSTVSKGGVVESEARV